LSPERELPRWLSDSLAVILAGEPARRTDVRVVERRARAGLVDLGGLHRGRGGFVYPADGNVWIISGERRLPAACGTFTYCPPSAGHLLEVTSPDARFLLLTTDQ
jgi:hypothetical protein